MKLRHLLLLTMALMLIPRIGVCEKPSPSIGASFHMLFGSTDPGDYRFALADGATALLEGSDGAVFVAGYSNRMLTDTGGIPGTPTIAYFSHSGEMIWQETFAERGFSVVALRTIDGHSLDVMLAQESYSALGQQRDYGTVVLWSISGEGKATQTKTIATLQSYSILTSPTESGLVIWEWERQYGHEPSTSDIRIREYDWQGNQVGEAIHFSTATGDPIFADHSGMLTQRVDWREGIPQRELSSIRRDGSTVGSVVMPDCAYCRILDVRRQEDSFEILINDDDERSSRRGVFLVRFDYESGTLHKVAEYPSLFEANVRFSSVDGEGLLLAGSDWMAPVVAHLSVDRRLTWVSRFMSGDVKAHAHVAARLSNGRLAVAGRTGRHLYADQEADTDAFLIVDSPARTLLMAFGSCIVADGSLARVLYGLSDRLRTRIPTWRLWSQTPNPVARSSSGLPTRLVPPPDCPSTLEQDLLAFATEIHDQSSSNTTIGPGSAQLTVKVNGSGLSERVPFYYVAQDHSHVMMPDLVTGLDYGIAAGQEIVENVLPVIDGIAQASADLKSLTGFHFQARSSSKFNVFRWETKTSTLSPRESAAFLGDARSTFMSLSKPDRAKIRHYARPYLFVEVVPGLRSITRLRRRIQMPAEEAGSIWKWVLSEVSNHQPRIDKLERDLVARFNVVIESRPFLFPKAYVDFLQELHHELQTANAGCLNVKLQYEISKQNVLIVNAIRDGKVLGTRISETDPRTLASWLVSIRATDCNRRRSH